MSIENYSPIKKIKYFDKEGYLGVYFGCMFAGKSRLLIMKLSKKQDLGLRVAYVTHGDDQRVTKGTNLSVTTHWSCFSNATVPFDCYRTIDLANIYDQLLQYDVIGIDEFQFFDLGEEPKTVAIVKRLVDEDGKTVYCVGLDTNFKRKKFGHIFELIPFADKCKKIRAKCEYCKRVLTQLVSMNLSPHAALVSAPFTAKIAGDLNAEKDVGSEEKYIPLCRYHYLEYSVALPQKDRDLDK